MQKPLILCVDSDQSILNLLSTHLKAAGYHVATAGSGRDALSTAAGSTPSLILHDLTLPDMNGLDLIKSLRDITAAPIIALTANGNEIDAVLAFEMGADDLVLKPFGIRELMARVRAVLRRSRGPSAEELIQIGPLTIDSENYEAFRNGEKMILTLKEFELLHLLAERSGKVLTRNFLLDHIWGTDYYGETRTVDVHIRHIRQKLGDDAGMIETVRGVGYRMSSASA